MIKKDKHIIRFFLILCALLCSAVRLDAREFEVGERIYFNGTPPNFNTWKNDAELWAQLKKDGSDYWLPAQWKGDIPYIEINSDCAHDWTNIVLARCQPGNRYNVYHQTGELTIDSYLNYIYNFTNNQSWSNWGTCIPAPDGDPSTWSLPYENEEICTSAAGYQYELTPKNREYSDKTQNSSWFEYNGSSWIYLQGNDIWHQPGERNFKITLGDEGYDKYFFFQCSTPSKCRLIRIRLNQDCSLGVPGACKITSFIAVASDANVTDQTCAVDGLVAFDDKLNAGDLMVWCDNLDTVTISNDKLEMPQTFKLKGFDASSTKTYTLHAKFLNGNEACESTYEMTVRPPAAPVITHTTLIRFTQEDVTLTPDNQSSTYFQWTNSANDEVITDDRNHKFTGPTEEQNIEYVFLATNDPPVAEGNLITNGSFENPDYDEKLESDYTPWGRDNTEYYASNENASGGYAITDNAQTFWRDYQNVTAHEGSYFGLFDSKIYDGSEQAAWIARTGDKNPKLKVIGGVSYLFSFWVANINAYDQMNNGARLQFQISYDGGTSWTNLGDEINLNNFKDHNWHGRSSIATPTESSDNVVIRVINLNQSNQNIGNDFALDDIRFEAVTSHSSNIAAYERFPVNYLECVIHSATFEQRQPIGCGTKVADVDFTVNFTHPRGDLYIYEGSTLLVKIPHSEIGDETTSYTGVLKDQPLDNADHVLTVYFNDGKVKTDAPTTYTYNAKAVPVISIASLEWGEVTCDVPTVTLTAVVNYTNQNGELTANVDGHAAEPIPTTPTYIQESNDPNQVTLIFHNITADGKTGHKLYVNFDGSHGCFIDDGISEAAPYMPAIILTKAEVQPYKCGDENYQPKVTVDYTNAQGHDLIITDEAGHEKILTASDAEYGTTSASWIFDMPWDPPVAKHTFKAYFKGAEACKDQDSHIVNYTSPAKPALSAKYSFTDIHCNTTTYTLQLNLTYTNQKGTTFYASVDGGTPVEFDNPYPSAQEEKNDVTLSIEGLLADGADHTYRVWTDNTEDCSVEGKFPAPFAPVISDIKVHPVQMECNSTQYDVVVTFDVTNGQGKKVTVWGKEKSQTFAAKEGENTVTFTGIETDTEEDYFDIWFEEAVNCEQKKTAIYTEPVTPHIDISQGPDVGDTDCDKTTYTVKFDIVYINQNGKLYAWIDDDESTKKEFLYKENQLKEDKVTIALQELPGDGREHTIHVKFDGEHSCELPPETFKAPFAPIIKKSEVGEPKYDCNSHEYNVELTINYINGLGRDIYVKEGTTVLAQFATENDADSHTKSVVVTLDFNAAHDLNIFFDGFETSCPHPITIPSVAKPALLATASPTGIDCNNTTYTLQLDLTYTNLKGSAFYAGVDGGTPVRVSNPNPNTQTEKKDVTLTITGLIADGANHTYSVWTDNAEDCSLIEISYTAPFSPVITESTATSKQMSCEETKYGVTIEFVVINGQGKKVTVQGKGQTKIVDAIDGKNTVTFEGIKTDTEEDFFEIWFEDATNICKKKVSYPEPATPVIIDAKTLTESVCNTKTYDVTISVEFENPHGDLVVTDGETLTITKHEEELTASPAVFKFKDIISNGLNKEFEAYFTSTPTCKQNISFIEPTAPVLGEITASQEPSDCDNTFTLTGTVEFEFGAGNLIITDVESGKSEIILDGSWSSPQAFTIKGIPADGKIHTISVMFEGNDFCGKEKTYEAPHLPVINSVTQAFKPEFVSGEEQYHVTLTVNYSNALGKDIKIKDGETEIKSRTVNTAEGTIDVQLDFDLGTSHDLKVYFDGREECAKTLKVVSTVEHQTICPGATIDWHGERTPTETNKEFTYTIEGEEKNSVATLYVDFYPVPAPIEEWKNICEGTSYEWQGQTYTEAGNYSITLETEEGCTYPATLHLSVFPTYDMPAKDTTIINGETYTWNGKDYETEGVYTETLETVNGCDSVVTLNLTVKENIVENVSFTIAEQCAGEGALEIEIQHTGHLTDARLTFSEDALRAGFENDTFPIENDVVTVPYNVKAGIFSVNIDLLFYNRLKHSASVPFTLLFPSSVLEQGWMDAIFVLTHDYNGGYDFTDFQWYKKGQLLVGETGPYLYQPLEVGAEYSAMLTELSGLKLMTCPIIITDQTDITLYPTIVTKREMIRVTVSQNAVLTLYSLMGAKVCTYSLRHGETQISVPGTQGIYFAEVVLDSGKRKVFKIMAR